MSGAEVAKKKKKPNDDGAAEKKRAKIASENTSKPSSVQMLKAKSGKSTTLSVAVPASIIENAQSFELKAVLVGQIARALTIYGVNEIVLFEDKSDTQWDGDDNDSPSKSMSFFVRNLQYLETPQYLRKQLLPVHKDLKCVGLLAPLDAPHHLRKYERLPYREGAVVSKDQAPAPPSDADGEPGCWVNCGFDDPVWVAGQEIPENLRVTVRLDQAEGEPDELVESSGRGGGGKGRGRGNSATGRGSNRPRKGVAVSPREPTTRLGMYWGYQIRIARNLKAVFEECPFEEGYDLTIGTSERGEALGLGRLPRYKHLLLGFGGKDPSTLFSRYVNVCPRQTSRTIRTEEALLISLASLDPLLGER
eukprot:TRINITY_DN12765_c0_g1_i2.p1 TRINITY_DN12765_c0_g1~~TRINITY_DN12765_c0_g1_i2.p1  ORF type:complete len:385 (-),score=57.16 TRINITY_DN12765_c0_g1_i2:266-1354(-)